MEAYNDIRCCREADTASTCDIIQTMNKSIEMGLASYLSTDQVRNVSQLNNRACFAVAGILQRPSKSMGDDSLLEEAKNYLIEALYDMGGVYSLARAPTGSLEQRPCCRRTCNRQTVYDEGMRYFKHLVTTDNVKSIATLHTRQQLVATVLYNIGQVDILQGSFDTAQRSLIDAYIAAESSSELTYDISVRILHNLGYIQYRNGDLQRSGESFTTALQICANHIDLQGQAHMAATLNCLGVLNFHMLKYDEKQTQGYLTKALSMQKLLHGPCSVIVATTLNNVGRLQFMEGNLDAAVQTYNEALRLRRRLLGDDSLDVAATIFNLGQTHHNKGDLSTALMFYEEFLRIAMPTLGQCHRDVAFILKCIAQIYHEQGNKTRAIKTYTESLALCQACSSVTAELSSICNKLGNLYFEEGDFDEALKMYQKGLEVERAVFDPFHPNIVVTLSNIAQIHKHRGDFVAAFSFYDEVCAIQMTAIGRRDPSVAGTLANIALMHYQNDNLNSALEIYQEALDIRRENFGEDNLDVASTLNSIGLVLFKAGILPLALESIAQSLKIRRSILGDTHRVVAVNLYNIATIHMELGNEDDAMRFYLETLRVERQECETQLADIQHTLSFVANVYQQRGLFSEALEFYNEALQVQRQYFTNTNDPAIAKTLTLIGHLHFMRGDAKRGIEAMASACRVASSGDYMPSMLPLWSLRLYTLAKPHPEGAAAA